MEDGHRRRLLRAIFAAVFAEIVDNGKSNSAGPYGQFWRAIKEDGWRFSPRLPPSLVHLTHRLQLFIGSLLYACGVVKLQYKFVRSRSRIIQMYFPARGSGVRLHRRRLAGINNKLATRLGIRRFAFRGPWIFGNEQKKKKHKRAVLFYVRIL